ncbi:MAG TPA: carboxylating nicotinate-nucleotide diphosphorylase [Herpetosiphonaceae bacterium]
MINPETASFALPAVDLSHYLTPGELQQIVERALAEDLGRGDITSDLLVPSAVQATAVFRARRAGVIAGLDVAAAVYRLVDPALRFGAQVTDGTFVTPDQPIASVSGSARSLLRGERVALNFMQRLSGIASLTARYVAAVRGTRARIVDTRKTTPGLRALEKYAVRAGGGHNHRRDLSDMMLVKDNHLVALRQHGLTLPEAIDRARQALPHAIKIEVEVDRVDQIPAALEARVDAILLDNMPPATLREAVALIDGRALTEASGGVNLETVRALAAAGVDLISVGALTHSAPALDIGLDFVWERGDGR